jgi:hypothetical protein
MKFLMDFCYRTAYGLGKKWKWGFSYTKKKVAYAIRMRTIAPLQDVAVICGILTVGRNSELLSCEWLKSAFV